jgi:polysaccharide biosynthesis protein PslH
LHPEAVTKLSEFCAEIKVVRMPNWRVLANLARATFNGLPFQTGYFHFRGAQRELDRLVERVRPDHVFCQLIRMAEYMRRRRDVPRTLDYMDVFSKGMERRLEGAQRHMRIPIAMEHKRLLRYEAAVFDDFDHHTIIAEQDRELIPHPRREEIAVVPNGVDFEFFQPREREKRFDLIFNGNMGYPSNVEAVEYLVQRVMPLIWDRRPATSLLISGANPAPRVQVLASERVTVSGWVDDVRESYASARVLVAPMLISIGLQNKLLEAMAMELPCLTSTLANNALHAEPGRELLVADEPQEYAAQALELLDDEARAGALGAAGREFVRSNYDWESTTARLERLMLGQLVG